MDASITIAHGMEIFEDISPLIPENLHAPITSIVLAAGRPDKIIYTLNDRGEFSIKNYITSIRSQGATRLWAKWIWNSCFPPTIAAFLWRLLRHDVPVDCRVQTRGIVLASRCRYCLNL